MSKYYYCVNTFKNDEPVQVEGYIEASNQKEAIQQLIDNGEVSPRGYEFLALHVV